MDLLSVVQAAAELGVSPRRVRALIHEDRLSAVKVGHSWILQPAAFRDGRIRQDGRPVSAANAWAILASLSGSDALWLDPLARSRLLRRMARPAWVLKALSSSEPRSAMYRWRFLPADVPKIAASYHLVRSGLASNSPELNVVDYSGGLDAYLSGKALSQIGAKFKPQENSDNPNAILRVPLNEWILGQGPVAPQAVIAADLINHPDLRVARAARQLLFRYARH